MGRWAQSALLLLGILVAAAIFYTLLVEPASLLRGANHDAAQVLAGVATALGVMIAIVAAAYAKGQVDANREAAAKSIYREYLSAAFANAEYSSDESFDAFLRQPHDPPLNRPIINEKRRWYVAHMLFALEEILLNKPDDPVWRAIAKRQIGYHARYIAKSGLRDRMAKLYHPLICDLVDEVDQERPSTASTLQGILGLIAAQVQSGIAGRARRRGR